MTQTAIEFIMHTAGYMIIYDAINYNREVKIKIFASEWWVTMVMVAIASILIRFN